MSKDDPFDLKDRLINWVACATSVAATRPSVVAGPHWMGPLTRRGTARVLKGRTAHELISIFVTRMKPAKKIMEKES
ncbi:MAG: hypothetical protein V5783_10515 [Pontiella sp.]